MTGTHIHRRRGTGSGTSCCHTAASAGLCQQKHTGCEGRKCSCASPQPSFDPTDPALPVEMHQGCCPGSEQQFLEQLRCPRCRDKPRLRHTPQTLPWSLDTEPWPCCAPVPSLPLVAAAIGRAPVRGAALGAGGAGGFAGAGLPHGGQDSPWSVHQVLGHCRRAERGIRDSLALPWSQGATGTQQRERAWIGKCSTPRSSQGGSSNQVGATTGNDSTGELRREERDQRALMRDNHH